MDERAAKLALARKKLKDHQEKKQQDNTSEDQTNTSPTVDNTYHSNNQIEDCYQNLAIAPQDGLGMNGNNEKVEAKDANKLSDINIDNDVNATAILISNKRILEVQVNSLTTKLVDLENLLASATQNYNDSYKKIVSLENNLKMNKYEYQTASEQLKIKDIAIAELCELKSSLLNERNSLQDQLEVTKTMLAAKEAENISLHSQLLNTQSELESTQLQVQQLTSGLPAQAFQDETTNLKHDNSVLIQKVSHLEQQLKIQIKDYQQLNNHYELYVGELNDQLKEVMNKNELLSREVQNLSKRENSLIEQVSDMEIRLQNYKQHEPTQHEQTNIIDNPVFKEMQGNYEKTQQKLQDLLSKYTDLQRQYDISRTEIENVKHWKDVETQEASENVSLLKLNEANTSDKIAAQIATEQNKKLKEDIHGLEDAFVKMTKDKLELTEKIAAEKFLNRELTIKLSEIDEKASDMQKKLKAKDEEMIRLQTSYRVIEEKYQEIAVHLKHLNDNPDPQENTSPNGEIGRHGDVDTTSHSEYHRHSSAECTINDENTTVESNNMRKSMPIPKDDAMVKLQERFLRIMDEVADLSDEKHRLEHIITQLQNETDTICEYVALYQQQRCLLKKRDEERTAQIKMFQSECTRLQSQLDELTGILTRFAEDKELSTYFQVETKHEDIQKVMKLLSNLKTNSLIDPRKSIQFNDFYPCSCCSGQLIEV